MFSHLPHSRRIAKVIELACKADSKSKESLLRLRTEGFFERQLSLYACFGNRDGDWVARCLADPSAGLRRLALSMAPQLCTLEQLSQHLAQVTLPQQRAVLKTMARRRGDVVDALLSTPTYSHPSLLALGSETLVRQRLAEVQDNFAGQDWMRLARQHPALCAQALGAQLDPKQENPLQRSWINLCLPHLTRLAPDEAAGLVERAVACGHPLQLLRFREVLRCRPQRLAPLLVAQPEQASLGDVVVRVAPQLSPTLRRSLLQVGYLRNPEFWLRRLAEDEREALWKEFAPGWLDGEGHERPHRLAWLGAELRRQVARRHLDDPTLQARPAQLLPYAIYLPWPESRAELQPWLGDTDPEVRGYALAAQVGAVRFAPQAYPELLGLLKGRQNEPDPVRSKVFQALVLLPPSRWQSSHLEALGEVLSGALKAADLSAASLASAQQLTVRILPFHPQWSASWWATLVQHQGTLSFYALPAGLSQDQCAILDKEISQVLSHWLPRERNGAIVGAASAVGDKLRFHPQLVAAVIKLTHDPRGYEAAQAFHLVARRARSLLPRLIPELLQKDESWALQAEVADYLSRQRQDLLTTALLGKPLKGRFATGKTVQILPIRRGFERWRPDQQAALADLLGRLAGEAKTDLGALRVCLQRLTALPGVPPTALIAFASLNETREVVRELALRALARNDDGSAVVGTLLQALDDQRARIAIYAVGQVLRAMPSATAAAILKAVNSPKITVGKEVLRLLGELRQAAGLPTLLERAKGELHRDLRIALNRALWNHLDREEVWNLLESAAQSPDQGTALGLAAINGDGWPPAIRARIGRLLARLLSHPAPRVRWEVLQRLESHPLGALSDSEFTTALLANLEGESADGRVVAARLLVNGFARLYPGSLGEWFGKCLHSPRSLQLLADQLVLGPCQPKRAALQAASGAIPGARWTPLRLPLQAASLPLEEFLGIVEERLASEGQSWPQLDALRKSWARFDARPQESTRQAIEERWAHSSQASLRYLALDYLVYFTSTCGWTEGTRESLERLCGDEDPGVAGKAALVFPPRAKV